MDNESKIDPSLKGEDFAKAIQAQQPAGTTPDGEATAKPPVQLYIIKTKISNENFVQESKDVNDRQKLFTYKFEKEIRDKIKAIRMKYKAPIYNSLDFYGLHVCGQPSVETIQKAIDAADHDFKILRKEYVEKLTEKMFGDEEAPQETLGDENEEESEEETPIEDKKPAAKRAKTPEERRALLHDVAERATPQLGAAVMFIPLDFQQIFKGNLYGQITDAIQYQVYSSMFERMEIMLKRTTEGKEIPERSRNALIKMTESLKSLNVTQDENVYKRLEEIRAKIVDGNIKEVAISLKAELDANKSRWAAIEL